MAKDKLLLAAKVLAMRSDTEEVAYQASKAAVLEKQRDIAQLESMQTDYESQIALWQSGFVRGLQGRLSMYGNLTSMLQHLGTELMQLEAVERRCADRLRRSLQQQKGVEKLQEKRQQLAAEQSRRAERKA